MSVFESLFTEETKQMHSCGLTLFILVLVILAGIMIFGEIF